MNKLKLSQYEIQDLIDANMTETKGKKDIPQKPKVLNL